MDYMITSAALYYEPQPTASVPLEWLDVACRYLGQHGLTCQQFQVFGPRCEGEGLGDMQTDRQKLTKALREGQVKTLDIYTDLVLDLGRYGWRAMISVDMTDGVSFWGIDEYRVASPTVLLREAFAAVKPIVRAGYAIGFSRRVSQGPDSYAMGATYVNMDEGRALFEPNAARERVDAWLDELQGERRYLRGRFRGAYPASILSASHLNSAVRGVSLAKRIQESPGPGLGVLTRLDRESWLWELSEAEMPIAEQELRGAGLLIE